MEQNEGLNCTCVPYSKIVVVLYLSKDRVLTLLMTITASFGIMEIYENLTFQTVTRYAPTTETSHNERVTGGSLRT